MSTISPAHKNYTQVEENHSNLPHIFVLSKNLKSKGIMLINNFEGFSLHRISLEDIYSVCEFVIKLYYKFHKQQVSDKTIQEDINKIYDEELNLFSESHTYVIYNNIGEIVGSIRAGLWNKIEKLPIQKEFGIDLSDVKDFQQVWHIGRFAIDPDRMDEQLLKKRVFIFKTLLFHALQHVCINSHNIMLAECDRKLHEKVKFLNISSHEMGNSRQYIGSETVPIINTSNGLKLFLWKHKHLQCTKEIEFIFPTKSKEKYLYQECCLPAQDLVA